jgi:hypothetical protein
MSAETRLKQKEDGSLGTRGLTVVPFVPFVGDEDGRKGVVIGEVDLRPHGKGG